MKIYTSFLFTLFIANLLHQNTFAQNPQWINFFTGNSVYDILDADSVFWIGTESRLVKINKQTGATSFFTPHNQKAFRFFELTIDTSGNVWMETTDFNYVKRYIFDGTSWQTVESPAFPSILETAGLLKFDQQNHLWGLSYNDTLFMYDGDSIHYYHPSFPIGGVKNYVFDSSGNIWMATWVGLVQFDGVTFELYDTSNSAIEDDNIWSVAVDHHQNIWMGMEHAEDSLYYDGYQWVTTYVYSYYLEKFDGINFTSYHPPTSIGRGIRSITPDSSDNLWMSTWDSGIVKFDGAAFQVIHPADSNLFSGNILKILIDKNQVKYFATADIGLIKFDDQSWSKMVTANSPLQGNVVEAIGEDKNNKIWMYSWQYPGFWLTNRFGLSNFNGLDWELYPRNFNAASEIPYYTFNFANDHQGNMWIPGDSLLKFDGQNWINSGLALPIEETNIAVDKNDNVWVAALYDGLYKVDQNLQVTNYTTSNSGLEILLPYGLCADSSGNIWCGFCSPQKFDGINSWTFYDCTTYGFPCADFEIMISDKSGNIWAYNVGVTKFDGSSFENFNSANSGLPSDVISCLAIDSMNRIWIGSGGLTVFDGATWQVFNTDNSPMLTDVPLTLFFDHRGNLWMGSGSGVTVYNENGVDFTPVQQLQVDQESSVKLFPNPASNDIHLRINLARFENVSIKIYNAIGEIQYDKPLLFLSNPDTDFTIDLEGYSEGVYFVQIISEHENITASFVKSNNN